jgi:hypothetical protein
VEQGVQHCSGSVDGIVRGAHMWDEEYAFYNMWNRKTPDSRMFSSFNISRNVLGDQIIATTVVPGPGGTCDAASTQILNIERLDCTTLKDVSYRDWQPFTQAGKMPVYRHPANATDVVVLVPSASGCLVVRTKSSYGDQPPTNEVIETPPAPAAASPVWNWAGTR